MATIAAEPFDLDFDPATTALVIIDMQRDFVSPRCSPLTSAPPAT
ncbi:MAG TPA: hypothetical protein VGD83_00065 [Streptosporangiaceae bacterium]